jgi:hypothetical protein
MRRVFPTTVVYVLVGCGHPLHSCRAGVEINGNRQANITIRVDYTGNPFQMCARVAFKGSKIGERHDWRWTFTTNQDVKATVLFGATELSESHAVMGQSRHLASNSHPPSGITGTASVGGGQLDVRQQHWRVAPGSIRSLRAVV